MDGNTGNHLIMNLILRPLADVNDVTWSIIWCLVILLAGVIYYIVYIMRMAFDEMKDE
jgi:MFS superfamily sulfate permease-like transporter